MKDLVLDKIWLTDTDVWIRTTDGRLDEDLSFEGFFYEKKSNPLYDIFTMYPELNAAAIARRLGMSQSLFAQYISGTKRPSEKRFLDIIEMIRSIGRELAEVSIS